MKLPARLTDLVVGWWPSDRRRVRERRLSAYDDAPPFGPPPTPWLELVLIAMVLLGGGAAGVLAFLDLLKS